MLAAQEEEEEESHRAKTERRSHVKARATEHYFYRLAIHPTLDMLITKLHGLDIRI